MATAVISASLPTIRPVLVHICRSIGLSQFVSSKGGRSRGISLPERSNQKTTDTAPLSSRATINREGSDWLQSDHVMKETDVVCHLCDSAAGLCGEHISNKSGSRPIITKTTEIHHEYECGDRGDSDSTSQKQGEIQAYSAV
jgi:hypothetical protein